MSTPRIYWYPVEGGPLQVIDFGEGLQTLDELDSAEAEDVEDGEGIPNRNFLGATLRFRVMLERFGDGGQDARERRFVSLQRHLYRGGYVGFSANHNKSWASITAGSTPGQGDLLLYTGGNGFAAWSPSGTVAQGDEISVENVHPEAFREIVTCGALTLSPPVNLPLGEPITYEYSSAVVARWRDFYPVCYLPNDQLRKPIITGDYRRNWTFDVELVYLPAAVIRLWDPDGQFDAFGSPPGEVTIPALRGTGGGPGSSLEQLLRYAPTVFPERGPL